MKSSNWRVALRIFVATGVAAQAESTIASVENTRQVCDRATVECPIPVFVKFDKNKKGSCEARVDMDEVRVKGKNTSISWKLYKDEESGPDGNTYAFTGDGIKWVDKDHPEDEAKNKKAAAEAAKDFEPAPGRRGAKKAGFASRGTGRKVDHHYKPTVRMTLPAGATDDCEANDPRIAND